MRLQSSLGLRETDSRSFKNSGGRCDTGEVVAVNYEYGTADVRLLRNGDVLSGGSHPELSCKILKPSGGTNPESGTYWGTQVPIAIGDYVVVGYLEGKTNRPFIMGFIDNTEKQQNICETSMQPKEEDKLKQIQVFPNQNYIKYDNLGNEERTFSNGFETLTDRDLSDDHGGTDKEFLTEKNKTSGKTLGLVESAKNFLKVVKTSGGGFVKFFIGKDGSTRLSQMLGGGKTNSIEFKPDGAISIRKQIDSDSLNSGNNFTQSLINSDGSITLTRSYGGGTTESTISADGSVQINVCSGKCTINVDSSGKVTLTSENETEVNSKGDLRLVSSSKVNVVAPEINLN